MKKLVIRVDIRELNPFQTRNNRKMVACVESPLNILTIHSVEDGTVGEAETIDGLPLQDFYRRWAVIKPAGRSSMSEKSVGPGWARK